jgi:hypothetical protein
LKHIGLKGKKLNKLRQAWIIWLAGKLPPCAEIIRIGSESLEQPIALRKRVQVKLHVLFCEWCERYLRQARLLRETLHHHPEDVERTPPAKLSPQARSRIARSLRDESN